MISYPCLVMLKSLRDVSRFVQRVSLSTFTQRAAQTDPQNHDNGLVGQFYRIPDDEFESCYVPQLKKDFVRQLRAFNDKSILIRAPAVEVIGQLKRMDFERPVVRYIFYGPIGAGKSVQMAHVSHYALRQGWLLLQFGELYDLLHKSPEMPLSPTNENFIDTPTAAVAWLQSFVHMNAIFLDKHRPATLRPIHWNQKESLSAGTQWTEAIEFAISRPKYASDCVGVLLREARCNATAGNFRILAIVRGANVLWANSRRCDVTTGRPIPAERFTVLCQLQRLLKADWKNGAIVCSVNADNAGYDYSGGYFPKALLGDVGFKAMDPFVPVSVGDYSTMETTNYLNFLNDNGWLTVPAAKNPSGIGRKEITFLSGRRPQELFNVTAEW